MTTVPDTAVPETRRYLALILTLSVVARVAASLYMGGSVESLPGIDDQRSYQMLAQRVLQGDGFTVPTTWWPMTRAGEPTAHWSYLYTLYLAAVYAILGVQPMLARLLQAVLVGFLWPLLAYRIARRLTDERMGLVAAGWTAIYGYFAYYSAALMTEAFFITAILWSLDLALGLVAGNRTYKHWASLGVAIGTAVLLRQSYLLFVPFLLAWLWLSNMRHSTASAQVRNTVQGILVTLAVIAVMIVPWTVRNYSAFGRFVLLNTNAGYAFFWANHPIYGTDFVGILPPNVSYQSLVPAQLRTLNEAALDSALMKEGLKFVTQDPLRYLRLSLSRFETYFMFWPSSESGTLSNVVRVLSFGVALPFMLWGLVLALRRWRDWSLLYLFVVVYSGLHLLSWALIRYRLPVDAVLLVFAGYGVSDLVHRLSRLRSTPAWHESQRPV